MKKLLYRLILLLPFLVFWSCSDDDDSAPQNSVDQLPDTTQTGEGTFACLVDGEAFIADNPYFNCYYQYVDGGWYFSVQGRNENLEMRTVILGATEKSISEGEILFLSSNEAGNSWSGGRFETSDNSTEGAYTNSEYSGELTISKLDMDNNIISGTFWFNIEHPFTGETIEIREGRFDTLFIP